MFSFVLLIHTLLCLALIGLVLIQQGKGADMGPALGGGGSNTLFGAGGATDFITKLTTAIAIAFMVTSIILVRAYSARASGGATQTGDPLAGSVLAGEAITPTAVVSIVATAAVPVETAVVEVPAVPPADAPTAVSEAPAAVVTP